MSIWRAITAIFRRKPIPRDWLDVTPVELAAMREINTPFGQGIPFGQRIDNKIALDLVNKDLVKLAERGYALTWKGMSVLTAKSRCDPSIHSH